MSLTMKSFMYLDAKTVKEAVSALEEYRKAGKLAEVTAGGTEMLDRIVNKCLPKQPDLVVNIKNIPDLNYIKEDAAGLKIGALAKLRDIESSSVILGKYPMLAEAAHSVGSPQIRNMGTIGGNLCQASQCWYYRAPYNYWFCYRKGGTVCYAVPGDNRHNAILGGAVCFHVCPSDMAPPLVALDAKVRIQGSAGERTVSLTDFYVVLGNVLKPDEIITEIQVPAPKVGTKQKFLKYRRRKAIDWAIASVAFALTVEAGAVREARIVLGGVAPIPYRATKAEDALKGKAIDEASATAAADAAVTGAMPLSMNAYKVQITKAIVKSAILGAA